MGVKTLIQEQNSYPGITNKILSKKVDRICVAYDGLEKYFPKDKIVLTGNPVRPEVLDISTKRQKAQQFFNLNPAKEDHSICRRQSGSKNDKSKRSQMGREVDF
jgi:UDP-N-acetylglucosamine--N-acetylmuramyl-(pentapeptide) pyrophosphoryl-undecaprenol N-acetylglucosamine transferase